MIFPKETDRSRVDWTNQKKNSKCSLQQPKASGNPEEKRLNMNHEDQLFGFAMSQRFQVGADPTISDWC